jgi:biopolymer transport protein ExbB/TolQ
VLGSMIAGLILGTTHIIGFNLLAFILVSIMFAIMVFCVWYTFRTKQKFQEQYDRDRNELQAEYQQFKQNWQVYFANERDRWDKWAIAYSQDREKEYKEHSEDLKRQCMEAIDDVKKGFAGQLDNTKIIFTNAVQSYERALDSQKQYLMDVLHTEMKELEQQLRKELSLHDEETITPP